ncbi:VOC family protein [Pedobacter gandavensis]|uniref:VOC family protein n=1 Tax=Pedobacter gandavensis TaxID=2679963 RepID=UPI00292D0A4A|nr:VOC family protein [Pedobacter gandavensis]
MMTPELNYQVIFVKNILQSSEFFVEKLGLIKEEDLQMAGINCPVLKMFNGHSLMLVKHGSREREPTVVYTDDCLRDFCTLKRQGVAIFTAPLYRKKGLSCEFYDPSGNHILLLEERDYTDA